MEKLILKNLRALNQVSLNSFTNEDNTDIFKKFTDESVKILEADFGFSWGKLEENEEYKLLYKTSSTLYSPKMPKKIAGGDAKKSGYIFFDEKINKDEYEGEIGKYAKSYLNIPIRYGDHVYGGIIACYKKNHIFSEEELALAETIGYMLAQTLTINWLIGKEEEMLSLAERQKETEVLLSQEKLKTEFIQNATHELRTPLAIMKGNVDLAIIHGLKDEKATKTLLNTVNTEIKHLSNIIEDLSIFTTEGKTTEQIIRSSSVDLAILLQNTVHRLQTLTKDKNISLNLTGEFGQSFVVFGDQKYLEKLFLNIIKNAINYGKENGNIEVEIKKVKNNAQIKIADDGIGIKPEELPKVFERFYRTEDARELKKKGIGLGLAISQWVTKIHGGTIDVKSTYGKGTTFTIELPLATNN